MPTNLDLESLNDAQLKAEQQRLLAEYQRLGDLYATKVQEATSRAPKGWWQNVSVEDRRALYQIQREQADVNNEREIVDTLLNRSGFVGGEGGIPTYPVDPATGQPSGPDSAGNAPTPFSGEGRDPNHPNR